MYVCMYLYCTNMVDDYETRVLFFNLVWLVLVHLLYDIAIVFYYTRRF